MGIKWNFNYSGVNIIRCFSRSLFRRQLGKFLMLDIYLFDFSTSQIFFNGIQKSENYIKNVFIYILLPLDEVFLI